MYKSNDNSIERIEELIKKMQMTIDKQSNLYMDAYPDMTIHEARELCLINKIATLTIALENMGKELRELQQKSV